MVQIVKNICDNPYCKGELKNHQYKIRLTHEWNSRSRYTREYCSQFCVEQDWSKFEKEAIQKDRSS